MLQSLKITFIFSNFWRGGAGIHKQQFQCFVFSCATATFILYWTTRVAMPRLLQRMEKDRSGKKENVTLLKLARVKQMLRQTEVAITLRKNERNYFHIYVKNKHNLLLYFSIYIAFHYLRSTMTSYATPKRIKASQLYAPCA